MGSTCAPELLEISEASRFLRFHPYLLLKCVKYQPRKNGGIRLVAHSEAGRTRFARSDLVEFDHDLRQPWVDSKDERRPDIPDYFKDALRHEADFVCGLCRSPLATDFAHIEPWETCLHHHPHNLICLCNACHTGYDREHRISKEEVAAAKQRLMERLTRFLEGQSMADGTTYSGLQALCRKLNEFIVENHAAFSSFGPESQLARDLPSLDVAEVWHKLRRETILPNNDEICRLLLTHRHLYDRDDRLCALADRFIAHAKSYKAFVEVPTETHNRFRFPAEFADYVKEVASGAR